MNSEYYLFQGEFKNQPETAKEDGEKDEEGGDTFVKAVFFLRVLKQLLVISLLMVMVAYWWRLKSKRPELGWSESVFPQGQKNKLYTICSTRIYVSSYLFLIAGGEKLSHDADQAARSNIGGKTQDETKLNVVVITWYLSSNLFCQNDQITKS